jgi:hypothetical protein
MPSNNRDESIERYYSYQEKNVYFLLAAAGSAIGFAITQTKVEQLSYCHILLGISVLSWGFSFYCGQNFIEFLTSYFGKEIDYSSSDFEPNIDPLIKKTALKKTAVYHSRKLKLYGSLQKNLLLLGAFFYILWHITKMVPVAVS